MADEKYTKKKKIGNGSFGDVYEGFCNENKEKKVAIKLISKQKLKEDSRRHHKKLEYYIDALMQEVKSMQDCECENSVKCYDFFDEKDYYKIIMELCDSSLFNYLKKREPFSVEEIFEIFTNLNKAFKIMVDNNIVHRDLKLENILIKFTNEEKTKFIPKLCDYGFSKKIKEENNKNTQLGTRTTAAPEVFENGIYGPKADLWSIGVIIYYCHFKKFPYDFQNMNNIIRNKKIEYVKPKNFFLADLIDKLLIVDKNERISWEDYFQHPFFKLSSLNEFDFGIKNDNLKYYKAKYKDDENNFKNVIIKAMKNNNLDNNFYYEDYQQFSIFKNNKNVLRLHSTKQLKDKNEKQIIYLIFECEENYKSLGEYCKEHNFEEKEIQKFIKDFYEIFKKVDSDIFISLYSFVVNENGEIKLIDFGLNKKFLSEEEIKIYYAPNEDEMRGSEKPSKTSLMNFGITLLKMINNNEDEIFYKDNKFNLNFKRPISEQLKSFLSKCLCSVIKSRPNWKDLENEINENKNLTLLNEKQFRIFLDNLLTKYKTINEYYSKVDINNLEYINENEDFIIFIINEIKILNELLNEKDFNRKEYNISFLSITDEDNKEKLLSKFFHLNSKKCYNIKLIENSFKEKEKKSAFIDESEKICQNLIKIEINFQEKTKSCKFSKIDNDINTDFFKDFVKNFGKSKFHKFCLSFILNINTEQKEIDYNKAYNDLNFCKYIVEYLLFFKDAIKSADYPLPKNSKESILNYINSIFAEKEGEKKYILISLLWAKFKNNYYLLDDDQFILKQDNKEALEKLINLYPFIIKLINFIKSKNC